LPVLGVAYAASGGPNCFPALHVCSQLGSLTFTSVISSAFDPFGQDILTNAFITGELTDSSLNFLSPITLTGTVEQEVTGRTTSAATGTWATKLLAVNLTGMVLGHTLTMTLDGSTPSTGTTSIVPIGDGDKTGFRIDSFFDVFVDLTLDTTPPLQTTRASHLELAPEPASAAVLTVGLLSLAASRRRRR
jgi:hypothetical protein